MNVSGLIEECRKINDPYLHKPFFDLVANTLEQQQAEIEALKADNEQMCTSLVKATRAILRKAQEK